MLRHFALGFAVLSTGCLGGGSATIAPLPPGGHHVLFVGNSLTYVNNLPATVAAIAESVGDTIRVATEAAPNVALIDHLNGATHALDRIAQGGWELVVLQQGPTPPGICRDSLILWTKMFDAPIRAAGAKTAIFMTWPLQGPLAWFDNIGPSFELAAAAVSGTLLPVGEAWRIALTADSTLQLYSPDGLHPSATGTFLAALEIYERVTGRDARTLPPKAFTNGGPFTLPEATIRALQAAAHAANTKYSRSAMTNRVGASC